MGAAQTTRKRIGRVLEAGKFHLGFFDARLAMPERFGGDHAYTVQDGIRCVKMKPIAVLITMGMATERLGQVCCEALQWRLWIHLHMRVPTPKIKAHNRGGQEVANQDHLP